MKIIFVSYDIGNDYVYKFSGFARDWDASKVSVEAQSKRLNSIIDKTGAKVVLTSIISVEPERFEKNGVSIYGKTKRLSKLSDEIIDYLNKHNDVEQFVVLGNDSSCADEIKQHFLLIELVGGILPHHVNEAIKILNSKI